MDELQSLGGTTAFAITYVALVVIIALRYFAIAGLFHWLLWSRDTPRVKARRLTDGRPRPATVRAEIGWSLISALIYALPGVIVIEAWKAGGTLLYTEWRPIDWVWIPVSVFICLFVQDTWFYWTHRLMHHPRLFRVVHLVHHRSRPPSPFAAFSFHPFESLVYAWLLPLLVFIIPIHVAAVLFILTLMTIASVLNHSGQEILPDSWLKGPIGHHLITAAHHDIHHRDFTKNFALYFRFWDKVMATDVMEAAYPFLATGRQRREGAD